MIGLMRRAVLPCLLCGMIGWAQEIRLPQTYDRVDVFWEDLTGDGQLDIWLRGDRDELWVWDAAAGGAIFTQVNFESLYLETKPALTDNGWQARAELEEGRSAIFDAQDGWKLLDSELSVVHGRLPRFDARLGQGQTSRATTTGLWLERDGCPEWFFPVQPLIDINKRTLVLHYPQPKTGDLDGQAPLDLFTPPHRLKGQGQLQVWTAHRGDDGWKSGWSTVLFPETMHLVAHAVGDLDGDRLAELVILARPAISSGIFKELKLLVYQADAPGHWQPVASQELETQQNFWQTGPVEINREGVSLFYYKGLVRSKLRVDHYAWNEAGYLEPKPETVGWKMKDADRDFFNMDYDFNGDGLADMLLYDDNGIYLFYRRAGSSKLFEEGAGVFLVAEPHSEEKRSPLLKVPAGPRNVRKDYARRSGDLVLVQQVRGVVFWQLVQEDDGRWKVVRLADPF